MASKTQQVYRCAECGAIIEVIRGGGGVLVCCGAPMDLYKENTTEAAVEKHIPVVEKIENGIKVRVGSVAHPMEEKHYIEWIEILADGLVYRKSLGPGDAPEAIFWVCATKIEARALCNLHGLWKTKSPFCVGDGASSCKPATCCSN